MTTRSELLVLHQWLNRIYGKADHCENSNCQHKSNFFEYAMIHEKGYAYDRNNFMQLCRSCHKKYDDPKTGKHNSRSFTFSEKTLKRIQLNKERREELQRIKKETPSHSNLGYKHELLTCPFCGLTGGENSMKRWHFKNCKLSPSFDPKTRILKNGIYKRKSITLV